MWKRTCVTSVPACIDNNVCVKCVHVGLRASLLTRLEEIIRADDTQAQIDGSDLKKIKDASHACRNDEDGDAGRRRHERSKISLVEKGG
ncbi:hypothetical protein X777_04283 [Ooceraea biroi]|uniref:Uncharacterized protein n=1 Tax=Ooceraea biroi TaxID=2015173 RepID=A0A026WK60_OOCBI|nr:hypothetical protein X777_04283 [Ooceraea biroi]